ncbi:MAG: quinone-dependent dihydroorotate dehydrogenase [bacterium]|nr:quinone-dependent dihydroorotate dehydrogenase [bacterium]
MYKGLIRPTLFRFSSKDPEIAHEWAISLLHYLGSSHWLAKASARFMTVQDPVDLLGLHFPNRVGLAAGFDKNARAAWGLFALGFGFIELGTITAQEQPGNQPPRIWRFPEDGALINAMGFNNDGADEVARRLRSDGRPPIPIGISIGKSKATPENDMNAVVKDYLDSLRALYPYGDYIAINVSSPNTSGLRKLQGREQLSLLVRSIRNELTFLASTKGGSRKPLLVKIAPDITPQAIDDILQVSSDEGIDGIIATNTTTGREGLHVPTNVEGGLSGRPLKEKALQVASYVRRKAPNLPLIGVGGIESVDDARRMVEIGGADLVQIYTGFIYEGLFFPRRIARGLRLAPARARG